MAKKLTHQIKILQILLRGETFISNDGFASNANQYFKPIKDQGIELIEWNNYEIGRHLNRKINPTKANIEKAEKYLNSLLGKPSAVGTQS